MQRLYNCVLRYPAKLNNANGCYQRTQYAAAPSGRCEDHLVYVGSCETPGGTSVHLYVDCSPFSQRVHDYALARAGRLPHALIKNVDSLCNVEQKHAAASLVHPKRWRMGAVECMGASHSRALTIPTIRPAIIASTVITCLPALKTRLLLSRMPTRSTSRTNSR